MLNRLLASKRGGIPSYPELEHFLHSYQPPAPPALPKPVSKELYERLSNKDIARVVRRFEPEDKELWERLHGDTRGRRQILLNLAAYYKDEAILNKTGLTAAMPPDVVHSMARGKLAAGGSTYYADLVIGIMETARLSLPKGAAVLDFGSSSGRVLRVLKAYRPDIAAYGCDPNEQAIKWASNNLIGMSFVVNPKRPPSAYMPKTFDLVYAISVWSHFNAAPGEAWFDEMHRIMKPGGVLFFTIHNLRSVFHYSQLQLREKSTLNAVLQAMYTQGFYFFDTFGSQGDWGVVDPEWGESYMSLSWLANRLNPKWELLYYAAGIVESNQDVVLLRAR